MDCGVVASHHRHRLTEVSIGVYMKSALVIGLGVSGRSAARFLLEQGCNVCGVDQNRSLLESNSELAELRYIGLTTYDETDSVPINTIDTVIVSPGIPPESPWYLAARNAGLPIMGEVELACRALNGRVLGVTGTNGKTTVTLLLEHILNQSGLVAKAIGNIGVPVTSQISECSPDQIFVLELSSYQLETLHSRVIDAGVILNITPDHLDRYQTMERYAQAKLRLKSCIKPEGKLYIEQGAYHAFHELLGNAEPFTYGYTSDCTISTDHKHILFEGSPVCALPSAFSSAASHDLENLLAAYALAREVGVTPQQFADAIVTFQKPPHRLEFVRTMGGINYYNDSKGTNTDAVVRAVKALNGETILIAGGVDKGSPYTPWEDAFRGRVRCICAIGQAAPKIKESLSSRYPVVPFETLAEAVSHASLLAKPGDNVLLSPGCASFDMFRDYEHRGEEFKRLVHALPPRGLSS